MLLLFSIRIAERPHVWERAVHFANCACLCECFTFCVDASFRFGFQGGMWDLIVIIPDHCLSIYFTFLIFTTLSVPTYDLWSKNTQHSTLFTHNHIRGLRHFEEKLSLICR